VIVVTPTLVDPLIETGTPSQPDLPINTLNIPAYDKALGANHSATPAAPPITPDQAPTSIPPVFPTTVLPPEPAPAEKAPLAKPTRAQQKASPPAPSAALASASAPDRASATVVAVSTGPALSPPTVIADGSLPGELIRPTRSDKPQSSAKIEVMTLSHQADAEAMVSALNRRGYNVTVDRDPKTSLIHLDIGPFNDAQDAEKMRQRLLSAGYDAILK
jgi:DedD protein